MILGLVIHTSVAVTTSFRIVLAVSDVDCTAKRAFLTATSTSARREVTWQKRKEIRIGFVHFIRFCVRTPHGGGNTQCRMRTHINTHTHIDRHALYRTVVSRAVLLLPTSPLICSRAAVVSAAVPLISDTAVLWLLPLLCIHRQRTHSREVTETRGHVKRYYTLSCNSLIIIKIIFYHQSDRS